MGSTNGGGGRVREVPSATSANTGLPAPFASLTPPNPCLVTAFAEEQRRKCRAQDCGFGNPETLAEKAFRLLVCFFKGSGLR